MLESARRDLIRIRKGKQRQLGSLGYFRYGESERGEPCAGSGDEVGLLRQHALGRVLRLFRAVASIEGQQLQRGTAERLYPALRVHVLDGQVAAHLLQLSLSRPWSRQRRDHADLHNLVLRACRTNPARGHRNCCRTALDYVSAIKHLTTPFRSLCPSGSFQGCVSHSEVSLAHTVVGKQHIMCT